MMNEWRLSMDTIELLLQEIEILNELIKEKDELIELLQEELRFNRYPYEVPS